MASSGGGSGSGGPPGVVIPKEVRDKIQSGEHAAAFPLLESFVNAKPDNRSYNAYSMLANCAMQLKDSSKAAAALEAALTFSPPKENLQKIWRVRTRLNCF
jgi:hypothetical protein